MPVASMTGFARSEGLLPGGAFVWEIRSVNGKGLEPRLRLPQGFEGMEGEIRRRLGARLARGNLQVSLSFAKAEERPRFIVNEAMLAEILILSDRLVAGGHAVTPTADGILQIRGVIDTAETGSDAPDAQAAVQGELLAAFALALDRLVAAREAEGAAVALVLRERLAEIGRLVEAAEADPARRPEAIVERLRAQIALLLRADDRFDEERLRGEAALLSTRADIREELDRLRAHLAAAAGLLDDGGPIGRRLDFLSQEFNRESNTICSKSNAASLTAIGLDLKVAVDQFREQVQNIE